MNPKCDNCPNDRYIGPYGDKTSSVAVVGEQPSEAHPDDSTQVFALDLGRTQRSSEVLEKVFSELDIEWEDLYWTNALKCPKVPSRDDCVSLLDGELLGFSTVITLGTETRELVPDGPYKIEDLWHPAYILRDPERFEEYVQSWQDAIGDSIDQQTLSSFS